MRYQHIKTHSIFSLSLVSTPDLQLFAFYFTLVLKNFPITYLHPAHKRTPFAASVFVCARRSEFPKKRKQTTIGLNFGRAAYLSVCLCVSGYPTNQPTPNQTGRDGAAKRCINFAHLKSKRSAGTVPHP